MTIDYSPIRADVMADPFPAYARLRAECPVHRTDDLGRPLYSVARSADVHRILLDHELWSNAKGPGIADSSSGRGDMQHDDPPEHTRRRLFVRAWFRPDAVAALEPSITSATVERIEAIAPAGRCDLYRDVALPLPVESFCEIMGIDLDDRSRFLAWADELVVSMAYPERGAEARRAMSAFTRGEVEHRRALAAEGRELPPGLLSHLATAAYRDDAPMPIDELVNMVNQLLIAGHETSTSLITNCVWRLLDARQARWERVVADPGLVANVVEESLRFDPPVLGLCRTNNAPTSVGDVEIDADTKVMVLYASANRDPERFDRADEFVVDRPMIELAKHYSFSWGIHHCLGAHLARSTARIVVRELVTRLPTMRLDAPPARVSSPFLWGRKSLPVSWEVGGAT
jgi:cytochrome P450